MIRFLFLLFMILLVPIGCGQRDTPVAPQEFNTELQKIMVCPENLTPLRLATQSELNEVNKRIDNGELRFWDKSKVKKKVQALLIRKDNKIAYEIRNGVAVMFISKAVVLDDSVGPPMPDKHSHNK